MYVIYNSGASDGVWSSLCRVQRNVRPLRPRLEDGALDNYKVKTDELAKGWKKIDTILLRIRSVRKQ